MSTTTEPRRLGVVAVAIALLTIAALLVAGGLASRPTTEVELTLRSFRFEPARVTVPAGEELTFSFVNDDQVAHDVSFGRDVSMEDGRPAAYAEDLLAGLDLTVEPREALSRDARGHRLITVAPGTTVTLRTVLPESSIGTWEIGCFQTLGCHYEAGLHGELVVK